MLKLTILTIGNKMPRWVDEAVQDYAKRLQDGIQLHIIELPLQRRNKTADLSRILEKESALIQAAIPTSAYVIALDKEGTNFDSEQLANKLSQLQHVSSHLCFLIGGPEGLSPDVLARSHARWSLSRLTLPHTLVRVVLIEALYRAISIINHHPYHK